MHEHKNILKLENYEFLSDDVARALAQRKISACMYKEDDFLIIETHQDFNVDEIKNEISKLSFLRVKQQRENEINERTTNTLLKGFKSLALGTTHAYDLNLEDQANIQSLVLMGLGGAFRCAEVLEDESLGLKTYKEHSNEQLKSVFKDLLEYKQSVLVFYGLEKERLNALESLKDLLNFETKAYENKNKRKKGAKKQ
ncbi:hypothetical protein [Helicobacter cetorum]|uniref:Uncharacterized protein n=1 Tax=Helicobacter cetorum (strain ATCC BAA-429 / MIT 00-7128) TaxID=182217 RepID=I0ELM7_HELC0|nr:hypothetical protein [Helicobacter cetorum]AFI03846.1 hypothetical protein HCW_02825 [Helicobacter cetorum MIT 00-7128]